MRRAGASLRWRCARHRLPAGLAELGLVLLDAGAARLLLLVAAELPDVGAAGLADRGDPGQRAFASLGKRADMGPDAGDDAALRPSS